MKVSAAADLFFTSMVTVKAGSTIDWYRKKLDPMITFFAGREIETIDLFDLEKFRATLDRESHAPGRIGKITEYTVHGYIRAIKTFFTFLKKRKIIKENPAEDLEKPRLPKQPRKGINPADAQKMIDASKIHPRDYAILLFTRDTGCRAGGVYNLLTRNIDLKHNKAIVREKGDKERTVFFTRETTLAMVLYSAVRENPNQDEHFFLSKKGQPLTYTGVYQIFRRLATVSKVISNYSPHQWRHGIARSWLQHDMNLKAASEMLGHSTEKVTGDIYGTSNEQELQSTYNRIMVKVLQDWPESI